MAFRMMPRRTFREELDARLRELSTAPRPTPVPKPEPTIAEKMSAAVERAASASLPVLPQLAEETTRFKEALDAAKLEVTAGRVTALAVAADHLAKACSRANDHQRAYVLDRVSKVLFDAIP